MLFVDNLKCHAGFIWIQAVMQQNTLLPKNESILNILVYIFSWTIFSRQAYSLSKTVKLFSNIASTYPKMF